MCRPEPERTPMAVYERPEPTTLPPTSRPTIHNENCCSHCGSGIDAEDKNCTRCGAPNENYMQNNIKKQTYNKVVWMDECLYFDSNGFTRLSHKAKNGIVGIVDKSNENSYTYYRMDTYMPHETYDIIGCSDLKNKTVLVSYNPMNV